MLLHELYGCHMGQATDLPLGKSSALHQQCLGIQRTLLQLIIGIPNSGMRWNVSVRGVSVDNVSLQVV